MHENAQRASKESETVMVMLGREIASSRARAILAMLHPLPVIMTVLAAGAFAVVADTGHLRGDGSVVVLVVIGLSQIAIAVYNDIRDLDMDVEAHSERALASGTVSVAAARALVMAAGLGSVALAFQRGFLSGVLVAVGTVSGLLYSSTFKRTTWSWVPFAVAFPLLPVWVFVAVGRIPDHVWTIFVIGVPLAVAIHLADSLPDIETDVTFGAGGLGPALGLDRAARACWTATLLASLLAAALCPMVNRPVLALAGAGVAFVVLLACTRAGPRTEAHRHLVGIAGVVLGTAWVGALAL